MVGLGTIYLRIKNREYDQIVLRSQWGKDLVWLFWTFGGRSSIRGRNWEQSGGTTGSCCICLMYTCVLLLHSNWTEINHRVKNYSLKWFLYIHVFNQRFHIAPEHVLSLRRKVSALYIQQIYLYIIYINIQIITCTYIYIYI